MCAKSSRGCLNLFILAFVNQHVLFAKIFRCVEKRLHLLFQHVKSDFKNTKLNLHNHSETIDGLEIKITDQFESSVGVFFHFGFLHLPIYTEHQQFEV